jgi:septum formation protein
VTTYGGAVTPVSDTSGVPPRFVLASASPARLALLRAAGIEPEVVVSGVDESAVTATDPVEVALTLARMKAEAVVARLSAGTGRRSLVLGCDSVLAFDGEVLGKPADPAEATRRWYRMRGSTGVLHTGHRLVEVGTGRATGAVASTRVHFADLSDAEVAAYVASGEPLHVAGAFTIDGLGGPFVERIEGDHGTVVGLSLPLLRRLLADLDTPLTSLWRESYRVQAPAALRSAP